MPNSGKHGCTITMHPRGDTPNTFYIWLYRILVR
nr:MAG TPA: hypothetical protein [Caudoviricetes sp.]